MVGEIFCTRPDRTWDLSSLLYNGYRAIPGINGPGGGIDQLTPSSAEVKEREELYIYSPLGLRGLCFKVTFTFTLLYLQPRQQDNKRFKTPSLRVEILTEKKNTEELKENCFNRRQPVVFEFRS